MSSILAIGLSQPPFQWVLKTVSLEVKLLGREANHSLPTNAEVKKVQGQLYLFFLG
jgi:hypothetical protein